MHLALGDREGALELYNCALAHADWLAENDPHDAVAQRDLSISYNKIGDILVEDATRALTNDAFQIASNLLQGADAAYHGAFDIVQRLVTMTPAR